MLNQIALLTLVALLVPSVAMAADGGAATDSTLQVAGVAAIVVAVALAVTRFLRVLEPLHDWLPSRAQWVPAALVGAAGILTTRLPEAQDWLTFAEVVAEAAVLIALAAAAGIRDPDEVPSRSQKRARAVVKAGPGLLVILVAGLLGGCAPSLEAARARVVPAGEQRVQRDAERCTRLSRAESTLRYVSVGAAVLGGGSGLAAIPVDNAGAQAGLGITAVGFAVVSGTTEAVRAEVAADWAEECQ